MLTKDGSGALDLSAAARIANDHYGIRGAASSLPGELDDNFLVAVTGGGRYVLKVMHPEREPPFVSMLADVHRHVEREAPELTLPRLVPSVDGAPFATARDGRGTPRLVLLLTWVDGRPLAETRPRTPALHESLGGVLGRLDRALASFSHPFAGREFKWNLLQAQWVRGALDTIEDAGRRVLVERGLHLFDTTVVPALPHLRRAVIHGDGNDWNVLVAGPRAAEHAVKSVIDFGDLHEGLVVAEPAVAATYTLLGQRDALAAAADVVRGYHAAYSLTEDDIAVVFPLILARLGVSVTNSAIRARQSPDDPYVTISEAPAWEALERLAGVTPALAHATFRAACGLRPIRGAERTTAWLTTHAASSGEPPPPVVGTDLARESLVLDLGVSSLLLGADPAAAAPDALARTVGGALEAAGKSVGIGRYLEARAFYSSPAFGATPGEEGRTVHLGLDFFVEPGTPVRAPLGGIVHLVADNAAPLDYGPLVVLRHEPEEGVGFFTLYGHLSHDTLPALQPGQRVGRGEVFARVGAPPGNGNWAPHLHLQVMLDLLDLGADFPGVARASDLALWAGVSPDPNLLVRLPASCFPPDPPSRDETLAGRRLCLGRNLRLSYRHPLKIVRGWMQHLYDDGGRAYLDTFNNVPLVGHSHPRVVRAAQEQLALLNTNTRYLHDNAVRYAERLAALMPEPLGVCYFVNSGSEANELALRLAGAHIGRDDVIVLEHAYHGNTRRLIDVSPYKFDGPGGAGRQPFVHVAPIPDDYRGAWRRDVADRGRRYAAAIGDIVNGLAAQGGGAAAFLAETLPSVGGQIVLPPGYLAEAYRHVRAAGGVAIADEVQVGFGRLGTHVWGFETQEVVPDIVVLGKPIGNGFPLAAVVTTPAIAASFDNGMEYFSTFGGNPVACAVGLAVLDVLRDEKLQARAMRVGAYLRERLEALAARHAIVGDVRGAGLFLGVEFVRDRETLEPATEESSYVVNRMRDRGVLCGLDGPYDNVLKIRPPLVFNEADADQFASALDEVLGEDPIRI